MRDGDKRSGQRLNRGKVKESRELGGGVKKD